jgi:ankyrin repeat protein
MQRQNREHQLADYIAEGDNIRAIELLKQGVSPNARQSTSPQVSFWETFAQLFKRAKTGAGSGSDRIGVPALVLATGWPNNDDLVRLMLEKGADVNAKDADGRTALLSAAEMGSTTGDMSVFSMLQEKGGDVKVVDIHGVTLLHIFARLEEVGLVKNLVAQGADVNAETEEKLTPLMIAAQAGRSQTAQELLAAGADVEAVDKDERSPLIYALGNGVNMSPSPSVVDVLIKHGEDINLRYSEGSTPLMYAAANCDAPAVKMLLERGADAAAKNQKGDTALSVTKYPEVKRLLKEALAKRSKKK